MSLLAPVVRVAGPDTIVPLPRLEDAYLPSEQRIIQAVEKTLSYE